MSTVRIFMLVPILCLYLAVPAALLSVLEYFLARLESPWPGRALPILSVVNSLCWTLVVILNLVDPAAMDRQLTIAGCDDRRTLPFHKALLAGELPLTIGGGIGQSRLCVQLLGKAHIGEVQASVWDDETLRVCQEAGVILL